jgi:hypothetical protein
MSPDDKRRDVTGLPRYRNRPAQLRDLADLTSLCDVLFRLRGRTHHLFPFFSASMADGAALQVVARQSGAA